MVMCRLCHRQKQDCEAGSIGAAIGEMVGDWLVTEKLKQSIESGEIKLGSDEVQQTSKYCQDYRKCYIGYTL